MQTCVSTPCREKKVPDFVQKPPGYTRFCQFPILLTGSPPTVTKTLNQPDTYYTNQRTHPPTHSRTHPHTHQPIHPMTTAVQQYVQQQMYSSTCTAAHTCVGTYLVDKYQKTSLFLCRGGMSIIYRFSAIPESERSVPGRSPLHAPRPRSRSLALVLSTGSRKAAVWGGRGATARAERSSGLVRFFRRCSFCGVLS